MKKKYSIRFLVATVTCLIALTVAYQMSYHHAKMELEKETEAEENNPSVATEGEAFQSDIYYLQELNGFIAVYQSDKKQCLNIRISVWRNFQATWRMKLRKGKNFRDLRKYTDF